MSIYLQKEYFYQNLNIEKLRSGTSPVPMVRSFTCGLFRLISPVGVGKGARVGASCTSSEPRPRRPSVDVKSHPRRSKARWLSRAKQRRACPASIWIKCLVYRSEFTFWPVLAASATDCDLASTVDRWIVNGYLLPDTGRSVATKFLPGPTNTLIC